MHINNSQLSRSLCDFHSDFYVKQEKYLSFSITVSHEDVAVHGNYHMYSRLNLDLISPHCYTVGRALLDNGPRIQMEILESAQ